jgi:hypothetical protein
LNREGVFAESPSDFFVGLGNPQTFNLSGCRRHLPFYRERTNRVRAARGRIHGQADAPRLGGGAAVRIR